MTGFDAVKVKRQMKRVDASQGRWSGSGSTATSFSMQAGRPRRPLRRFHREFLFLASWLDRKTPCLSSAPAGAEDDEADGAAAFEEAFRSSSTPSRPLPRLV